MLVEILSGRKRVLPHVYGARVVDGEAEFCERHVQLVHRGQVLPRLAVALHARTLGLEEELVARFVPLLLALDFLKLVRYVGTREQSYFRFQ